MDFQPWRLAAQFHPSQPTDAGPLLEELSSITDITRWGLPFRCSPSTTPGDDFETIVTAMIF